MNNRNKIRSLKTFSILLVIILTTSFYPFQMIKADVQLDKIDNELGTHNQNGDILYVGGTGENNFSTIQKAVDEAKNNDIIFVYSGIYNESIVINKSISIIGEDRKFTMVDGIGKYDIFSLFSNAVKIFNFTIQNGHFGILIQNTSDHVISENDLINNLHGISIKNSNNVEISKNNFTINQYGIRLYSSYHIAIKHNNFNSFKLDIYIVGNIFLHFQNKIRQNFWGESKVTPHIIFGKMIRQHISFPFIMFDLFPLINPYEL